MRVAIDKKKYFFFIWLKQSYLDAFLRQRNKQPTREGERGREEGDMRESEREKRERGEIARESEMGYGYKLKCGGCQMKGDL